MNTNVFTISKLASILEMFGVPVETWGKGEAKDIGDFYKEIVAGESYLHINNQGIARVVEIVEMHFKSPQPWKKVILKEVFQILPDGRKRERNLEPAGKVKAGETPTEALIREVFEEVKLKSDHFGYRLLSPRVEVRQSKSYPGITCKYIIYPFEIVPDIGTHVLQREFEITEENGTVLHFEWAEG